MSQTNVWIEGHGRYPFISASQLYWIERLASPERHWIANFRGAIGSFRAIGPARDSVDQAKADADADLESLNARGTA